MRNGEAAIIDFGGDMSGIAEGESVTVVDDDAKMFRFFSDLLPDFKDRNVRKKKNAQAGMSDEEIYVDMCTYQAKFIFIADFADFATHVMHPTDAGDVRAFVENILDKGSLHNVYWAACYTQENASKFAGTKIYDYFLKYKTGIHFGGNVIEQKIMNFDYVPYAEQKKSQKPGIGMLPVNDYEDVCKVVVPLVKG